VIHVAAVEEWARLLEAGGEGRGAPASEDDLVAFEDRSGFALHSSVRAAWANADGCDFGPHLKTLSLAEAAEYVDALPGRSLFAFTDEMRSPFCVACDPILDGRVVRVFHDGDEPQLAFRDLEGFAKALLRVLKTTRDFDDLQIDYRPSVRRAPDDVAAGRALLAEASSTVDSLGNPDWNGLFYVRIACDLMSDAADLAPVLEWRNEYARASAENRLEELGESPGTREALCEYDARRKEFDQRCIEALGAAGFSVKECRQGEAIRIGPPDLWLNVPMFYSRRREPDAMEYLVERARALTKLQREAGE
jgi:hypothetical protein